MKQKNKAVFKTYAPQQISLLPYSYDELIPQEHLVRMLNKVIDKMNIDPLISEYKGGGTSSYHPKMLLKVIVYAYCEKIYSSRRIAKALRENIHFMWLSGANRPDFRTINRFRSSRLKDTIDKVFASIVELLVEEGFVRLEDYFLDGTKIEANANKYSFVWKKSVERNKIKLTEKIKELINHIDQSNDKENKEHGNNDLPETGEGKTQEGLAERLNQKVKEIDAALKENPKDKELKKTKKIIEKDYLPRLEKYENDLQIMGNRNSYSKTDNEATFMRMKEDHMLNGQLKAGYNVQMATEDRFILSYSIHQKPSDSTTLIPHLENAFENHLPKSPKNINADAGYGSEQNYQYLKKKEITAYVKFQNFHYEQTKKFKKNIFRVENLAYDESTDSYVCPNNKRLNYKETVRRKTDTGFLTERRIYQSEGCEGCPLRTQCYEAKYDRKIEVSPRLNQHKQNARELLNSPKGKELRSRRCVDVEQTFGQIKHNMQFKRFLLRGIKKVNTEFGIIAMAHNIKKRWATLIKKSQETLFLLLENFYQCDIKYIR
jgi:transposase